MTHEEILTFLKSTLGDRISSSKLDKVAAEWENDKKEAALEAAYNAAYDQHTSINDDYFD